MPEKVGEARGRASASAGWLGRWLGLDDLEVADAHPDRRPGVGLPRRAVALGRCSKLGVLGKRSAQVFLGAFGFLAGIEIGEDVFELFSELFGECVWLGQRAEGIG